MAKRITSFYLVASIWFVTMLAAAALLLTTMGTLYESMALAPEARALVTMTLAIVAATAVAALVGRVLLMWARPAVARSSGAGGDTDAALATLR